jgi:hypothetical protein
MSNEVVYAFLNEENYVLGTAVVIEDDFETINRIKQEDYQAVSARPIDMTKVLIEPLDTYWDGEQFRGPKPLASFVWDKEKGWIPPIPYPSDGLDYYWNEETLSWIEVQ